MTCAWPSLSVSLPLSRTAATAATPSPHTPDSILVPYLALLEGVRAAEVVSNLMGGGLPPRRRHGVVHPRVVPAGVAERSEVGEADRPGGRVAVRQQMPQAALRFT